MEAFFFLAVLEIKSRTSSMLSKQSALSYNSHLIFKLLLFETVSPSVVQADLELGFPALAS